MKVRFAPTDPSVVAAAGNTFKTAGPEANFETELPLRFRIAP